MAIRATCTLSNDYHNISGNIMFVQEGECIEITGEIIHLLEGHYSINIHEFGDISFKSTGEHFNPHGTQHGLFTDTIRHAGDLGEFEADSEGVAQICIKDDALVKLTGPTSIVGRSLVISKVKEDTELASEHHDLRQVAYGIIGITK